jgi:hypothetical protein
MACAFPTSVGISVLRVRRHPHGCTTPQRRPSCQVASFPPPSMRDDFESARPPWPPSATIPVGGTSGCGKVGPGRLAAGATRVHYSRATSSRPASRRYSHRRRRIARAPERAASFFWIVRVRPGREPRRAPAMVFAEVLAPRSRLVSNSLPCSSTRGQAAFRQPAGPPATLARAIKTGRRRRGCRS